MATGMTVPAGRSSSNACGRAVTTRSRRTCPSTIPLRRTPSVHGPRSAALAESRAQSSLSVTRPAPPKRRLSRLSESRRCWSTSVRGSARLRRRRMHRRSSATAFRSRREDADGRMTWEPDAAIAAMYPRLPERDGAAAGRPSAAGSFRGRRLSARRAPGCRDRAHLTRATMSSSRRNGNGSLRVSCSESSRSSCRAGTSR